MTEEALLVEGEAAWGVEVGGDWLGLPDPGMQCRQQGVGVPGGGHGLRKGVAETVEQIKKINK